MSDVTVTLPYGDETVNVRIPSENLIGVYSPNELKPVAHVRNEIVRAIDHAIGSTHPISTAGLASSWSQTAAP